MAAVISCEGVGVGALGHHHQEGGSRDAAPAHDYDLGADAVKRPEKHCEWLCNLLVEKCGADRKKLQKRFFVVSSLFAPHASGHLLAPSSTAAPCAC